MKYPRARFLLDVLTWSRQYVDTKKYFKNSELRQAFHTTLNNRTFNDVLEIGTFEGVFACFCAKHIARSVVAVDPFDSSEISTPVNEKNLENFYSNLTRLRPNLRKKITLFKMTSNDFFATNFLEFDFIYVDGSHEPEAAITDLECSMSRLKLGGVLWIDDYGSNYKDLKTKIDNWVNVHSSELLEIHRGYQLGFSKKNSFNNSFKI